MARSSWSFINRHRIDNSDDCGIDRRLGWEKGKARFSAAHEEHLLAGASSHGVNRHQRPAGRLTVRRQRLDEKQLEADEVGVLASGDDVANYSGQMHGVGS